MEYNVIFQCFISKHLHCNGQGGMLYFNFYYSFLELLSILKLLWQNCF